MMKKIVVFCFAITCILNASIVQSDTLKASLYVSDQYIEKDTMKNICENIECLNDVEKGFSKFFKVRPYKAMAIEVARLPNRKKLVMKYWSFDHGTPAGQHKHYDSKFYSRSIAGERALSSCSKKEELTTMRMQAWYSLAQITSFWGRNSIGSYVSKAKLPEFEGNDSYPDDSQCRILFYNSNIESSFFKQLMATPPGCESGYVDSPTDSDACIIMPTNSRESTTNEYAASGLSWTCNAGYSRLGDGCKKDIVIPDNAETEGSSWTCNENYYRNDAKTACLKVPLNSTSSSLSNTFKCNTGFKKSANQCIPKIVIPANAKASGSSFMCNSGYYKNSSSTGCLKVPVNAKKLSNDKGWSCNTGFTKTGTACTNTAELERINKAKKSLRRKLLKSARQLSLKRKITTETLSYS